MSDWRESIARQLIERAEDDATTPLLMKIELARECFDDYSKLERELAAARAECEALRRAVDAMMAPLGYHGTISAKDDRVLAVMDALAAMREGKPTVREEG